MNEKQPESYAVPTALFQAILQILGKLPWEQVQPVMNEVLKCEPTPEVSVPKAAILKAK